jgi:DNA-binding beta-propeller fold protein YncE
MYAADRPNHLIEQFNLSTPWDISSPSASSTPDETLDVTTQSLNPYVHSFNPDGTKMWVTSISYDNIVEYNLSTPWSISSGSYSGNSLSLASQDLNPGGGAFKTNGSKLYITGGDNLTIYQYSTR